MNVSHKSKKRPQKNDDTHLCSKTVSEPAYSILVSLYTVLIIISLTGNLGVVGAFLRCAVTHVDKMIIFAVATKRRGQRGIFSYSTSRYRTS